MSVLKFEGSNYSLEPKESVLDCLLRNDVAIPNSCRSGACQSCTLRSNPSSLPKGCQPGIKQTHRELGYFLACQCIPAGDLEVSRGDASQSASANVKALTLLSKDVMKLELETTEPFPWQPGQFVHLSRPSDGLMRPYSVASQPDTGTLELHVRKIPTGRMSTWIHDSLQVGDSVSIRGPVGECFYVQDDLDQPILLAGVGTGLAPLWGILHHALRIGHRGRILLIHGGLDLSRLYLSPELKQLARDHPNLEYAASVVEGEGSHVIKGSVGEAIKALAPNLAEFRSFLCGDPTFVTATRKQIFLAGVPSGRIHADPFITAPPQ